VGTVYTKGSAFETNIPVATSTLSTCVNCVGSAGPSLFGVLKKCLIEASVIFVSEMAVFFLSGRPCALGQLKSRRSSQRAIIALIMRCWLAFDARFRDGLRDLRVGDEVIVLTWLDRARDVLVVHPREDPANPLEGVFNTRSPDRPNPIGLHRVAILDIQGTRFSVRDLEALDRTPIVDVKPVLDRRAEQ